MKKLIYLCLGIALAFTFSCAKGSGVAPGSSLLETVSSPLPSVPSIPTDGTSFFALVYGASAQDRAFLSDRIAGYQAPGLADVFNQWRRISGANLYNTMTGVTLTPAWCFSGFDSNRNWLPAVNPGNGQTVSPSTDTNCVNSDPFVASSWSYIASPDRLYNAANSTNFNGFISALKFSAYSLDAVLSSTNTDDDGLGIIIAAVIDNSNNIHTLTAMRTQGGMAPTQGWAILYKTNNTLVRTIDAKSVGGVNTNGSAGDRNGWNGRKSLVRVIRSGDLIEAYASVWGTGATVLTVDPASKITVDLSDPALSLSVFQGEQYYGYGSISQVAATFSEIVFSTPNTPTDPTYIYDLVNNSVYLKSDSGGYNVVPGAQALSTIGYPKRVKNTETSKEFMIDSATGFTPL
jgi:hypothetical protein